ncbi:hypothetical protein ACHAWF_011059 [Thalassiosira exigua]
MFVLCVARGWDRLGVPATDVASNRLFRASMHLFSEGVGKSSLVSSFVSRHFSGQVPGILTRVRLPPDPALFKCTTTIVDTQGGDAILSNALALSEGGERTMSSASVLSSEVDRNPGFGLASGLAASEGTASEEGEDGRGLSLTPTAGNKRESIASLLATTGLFRSVDAIVLVYDLDRIETFHRLEDHWLPLIEECFGGDLPVIVAGNKADPSSASQNSPSREQIISLLQRFRFVRQCTKCSAKKLLRVDEVFVKSQQAVVFPIGPLYDLKAGRLTPACSRAFTRIFRMFDMDRDGLLSDMELNAFQQTIWKVSLTEKDLAAWKNMATQHDHEGDGEAICDGKFTLSGFLVIVEVLITSQNRLEVPWKVLRTMGCDDELNLNIPQSISPEDGDGLEFAHLHPDDWRLSRSDIDFLRGVFHQFDSDGDGTLSPEDVSSIFSVLSISHPPWDERGASVFQGCFSRPHINEDAASESSGLAFDETSGPAQDSPPSSPSSIVSASGITITSSPLPSVDITKDSEYMLPNPLSYLSWMNHWHMIFAISPCIARAEMYKLGHSFGTKSRGFCQAPPSRVPGAINTSSTFIRALVLGSKESGKRGLIQKLHQLPYYTGGYEIDYPSTSCSVSKIIRPNTSSSSRRRGEETIVHVILTEIPELDLSNTTENENLRDKLAILLGQSKSGERPYDMAVLVFDATDGQSLKYAKDIESSVLTEEMPRVLVGTTSEAAKSGTDLSSSATIHEAFEHCKCMDIEPPLIASLCEESKLDSSVLQHLISCAQDKRQVVVPFRSTPHGDKRRRRKRALWLGGLVTAGLTVVLGMKFTGSARRKPAQSSSGIGGWLSFFRRILPF